MDDGAQTATVTKVEFYSHNMDDGAPAGAGVTVEAVDERLGDRLEQIIGLQVGLPERLAHAVHLPASGHRSRVRSGRPATIG